MIRVGSIEVVQWQAQFCAFKFAMALVKFQMFSRSDLELGQSFIRQQYDGAEAASSDQFVESCRSLMLIRCWAFG